MDWIILFSLFLSSVILHEVAHGVVAYFLGDSTAKDAGRLSLNPIRHIDPFWSVLFPAVLFLSTQGRFAIGMAKPVPVNFSRLHEPKHDMIWVGLAGPATNFILAILFSLLWKWDQSPFWIYGVYVNLGLGLFNMIPIPPLDGSRVLAGFLPGSLAQPYLMLERFGFLLILLFYFTGWLYSLIIPAMSFLCALLNIPIPQS
jgi:Zn-dependent protease